MPDQPDQPDQPQRGHAELPPTRDMPRTTVIIEMHDTARRAAAADQAIYEAHLAREHRRGRHPYGSMRRDCPLCRG